jgi:hypothetical protein
MTIPASCPDCGATYRLADALQGKRVVCKSCQAAFVVRRPDDLPRREVSVRRDFDEEDRPDSERGRDQKRAGISPILWVCGGGVLLLLLLCGVCGGLFYQGTRSVGQKLDDFADNVKQQQQQMDLNPVFNPVRDLPDALARLQENNAARRQDAARWLARQPVDPRQRAEVARALEPLLNDLDDQTRSAGMQAMEVWAGPENVPAIVRLLESDPTGFQGDDCRRRGIDTLVRLKDPRGAPGIARSLKHPFDRERARRALAALGSPAEMAVHPYLEDNDWGVKVEACKTLQLIGTRRSLPALQQTLEDTKRNYPFANLVQNAARDAIRAVENRK